MLPSVIEYKGLNPFVMIEMPIGNLEGREVKHRRQCERCCDEEGKLAWKVMFATILLATTIIGSAIGYGIKTDHWNGASIIILAGGFVALNGWFFFNLVHPRGGCCCCYNGQCC